MDCGQSEKNIGNIIQEIKVYEFHLLYGWYGEGQDDKTAIKSA